MYSTKSISEFHTFKIRTKIYERLEHNLFKDCVTFLPDIRLINKDTKMQENNFCAKAYFITTWHYIVSCLKQHR